MTAMTVLANNQFPAWIAIVLFLLGLAWIFFLKGRFRRPIVQPPMPEKPLSPAQIIVDREAEKMGTFIDVLRDDLRRKEARIQSGATPLRATTIAERRRAVDSVAQLLKESRLGSDLGVRIGRFKHVMEAYMRVSIAIRLDTIVEWESILKNAEAAPGQPRTPEAMQTINDLREKTTAANGDLRQALESSDIDFTAKAFDRATKSMNAAEPLAGALRESGVD